MIYFLKWKQYLLCIPYILISILATNAQEKNFVIPDSLKRKDYKYLDEKAQNNSNDTILSLLYLNTYLAKAISDNNSLEKVNGYIFLSYYTQDKETKFSLINNALLESHELDDQNLVSLYIYVGTVYHDYFEYEAATTYYLKALKIAETYNSKNVESVLLNNIAKIKEDIGKHEQALPLYKKCYAYEILKKDTIGYLGTIINIAESMRNNKMHDSASYYYKTIVDKAYNADSSYGNLATVNEGINLFYKKNYKEAEKLLLKGSSKMDFTASSQKHYILATLYLGKIQLTLYNDKEKAKGYFTKIDSLVSQTKAVIPKTIEAYEFLISYYKEKKNLKKQLDIVIKLSELRETISLRKIKTVDMLHAQFDTPQLLKNKEALIQQLERKATTNGTKITYLIFFILLLIVLFVLQYRKHRKRFDIIISELDNQETKNTPNRNTNTSKLLPEGIDETTITKILHQLDLFEKKKGFLQKDITLAILAKKCNTNTKYLPKIIQTHKNKSFVNYINNLRIDYILKELKENTTLQKYTIKTVSEEAGFNTAESFARAFKNKTGIRPSYYIRNLKKR